MIKTSREVRKLIFLLITLVAVTIRAWADRKVVLTASALDTVTMGDQFRLSYTVNTIKVRDLRVPFIKGFNVLMRPNRPQRIQSINRATNNNITFTCILMATAEREYSIPGATITTDGDQMASNSVKVRALPPGKARGGTGSSGTSSSSSPAGTSSPISDQDLLTTATASRTNVYKQEAFPLTFKTYTRESQLQFGNVKLPDFKGFHSQEIETLANAKWSQEHYKERNYFTAVYRQFVLFPQQSGELTIEPTRFDTTIAKAVRSDDPFDAFFNGDGNYVNVSKVIVTPKITINVTLLPTGKPTSFSGEAGEFSITSSTNSKEVRTNDAITVKLVISGTGNLKLIANPGIKFPGDFDVYEPKMDSKVRLTQEELSGSKVIEYLAIPRYAGVYKVPGVSFDYFNIKSKSYKTLSTENYEVKAEKRAGNADQVIANSTNKEGLKILDEGIRYIKLSDVKLQPKDSLLFGSLLYWLFYTTPATAFIIFFIVYRKQAAESTNVAEMRIKKASKVATRRMKLAGKSLAENKREAFYDEVLKALWRYISDKLSIPVSCLSKDNVKDKLRNHGVSDELIKDFLTALDECEFTRLAPGDEDQAMDKVYSSSLEAVSKVKNSIKC